MTEEEVGFALLGLYWKLLKTFGKALFFIFAFTILQPFLILLSDNPEFLLRLVNTVEGYERELQELVDKIEKLSKIN